MSVQHYLVHHVADNSRALKEIVRAIHAVVVASNKNIVSVSASARMVTGTVWRMVQTTVYIREMTDIIRMVTMVTMTEIVRDMFLKVSGALARPDLTETRTLT